MENIGLFFLFL